MHKYQVLENYKKILIFKIPKVSAQKFINFLIWEPFNVVAVICGELVNF